MQDVGNSGTRKISLKTIVYITEERFDHMCLIKWHGITPSYNFLFTYLFPIKILYNFISFSFI